MGATTIVNLGSKRTFAAPAQTVPKTSVFGAIVKAQYRRLPDFLPSSVKHKFRPHQTRPAPQELTLVDSSVAMVIN